MTAQKLKNLQQQLNVVAEKYKQHAAMQNEIAERLLEHLQEIKFSPQIILDLGAKAGYSSHLLQKKFPRAKIISLDLSVVILAKIKKSWFKSSPAVVADLELLPFFANSIDLVVSNLSLHWFDYKKVFAEVFSILKLNGLFLFSTFGLDTLTGFSNDEVFVDMHNLGDALLQLNFSDPVMETEHLNFVYKNSAELYEDLQNTGYGDLLIAEKLLAKDSAQFNADFEIIYGMAWKRLVEMRSDEVIISVDAIKKQR